MEIPAVLFFVFWVGFLVWGLGRLQVESKKVKKSQNKLK
jgi:hypothetical protein